MDSNEAKGLPPPPPVVPPNLVPEHIKKTTLLPMARRSIGSKGVRTPLLTNHFRVNFNNANGHFYHYSVAIKYEDGSPMEAQRIFRKILEKVQETYLTELGSKYFAYDGQKNLFTVGALPSNKMDFSVVLEDTISSRNNTGNASPNETNDADRKRSRRPHRSKKFVVEISYAARIPMQALASALQGRETDNLQDATRVLDVILRQNSARQGCLLVRQSFFHNDAQNFINIGGGVVGVRGFHTSFRTTQRGLSLNIDTSTTMVVQPGPVINFLLANQNVNHPNYLDWNKARRALKNLRVKVSPSNREYKITGLSEERCKYQMFTMNSKNNKGVVEEVQMTVYHYFTEIRGLKLEYSGDFPCINVGKPKRPTYIPIEHCELVSLQRYTKSLSSFQKASLVENSRQRPHERMASLANGLKNSNYNADLVLQETGVSIGSSFIQVEGRVLPAPRLRMGNGEEFQPRNGRWNFNYKKLVEPATVTRWAVVNFSAPCDTDSLISGLIRCGRSKGINVEPPYKDVFQENPGFKDAPPNIRVEKMFEQMRSELGKKKPLFLLCILAEKKNSLVYGPWKKKNLIEHGIVTQCIAPPKNIKDQYITNVLLKINAKLGGLNSLLAMERSQAIMPLVTQVPTFIVGMDVSHGSPSQSDVPSIAAVVGSREWPLISKYRACVRTQYRKVEIVDNLFKPVANEKGILVDEGIFWELLFDFYSSSGKRKPEHIIIFRDGVSDSQFNQVLNIELDQMMQACKFVEENWEPKFTVIIAQKNHHTKFFRDGFPDNVPPGTIVDSRICHAHNNDFYLCAHAGVMGTTRPTHYHVLYDEIGFSTDDLQELVHSLSYVYQRSTSAISVVAPICYAHLAAVQMGTVMKFEDTSVSETSSIHAGITRSGEAPVPPMPMLNSEVASSMFFC
ncbi:Protein argonaute 9 [Raphanus sativus]|uniref:Protein argonaute 9 n=1 Tax=Raphanus sativus TaxID=3726 RepID=A0A6J0KAB4_RAPSA|nr:protein argonaute 9 [Raphanus sativus]KAJ4883600.1 Protein argonaute 9 [Raphanus sativus]